MNQNSRQEAKSNIEKDFYKLLNNSNFGDCRNNINNCVFELIFDEIEELRYVKKIQQPFPPQNITICNSNLLREGIELNYGEKRDKIPF